jgi:addiction module HigA family antidote
MARTPIHPGKHHTEELKELSISAAELARQIDVPVNRVTGIINVQRAITADTALGSATGSAPVRNFGSICKCCMSCAWRAKKLATVWKGFPSSRPASAAKPGEPRNTA